MKKAIKIFFHLLRKNKYFRIFSEGGNYGYAESINVVNALNKLNKIMVVTQADVIEILKQYKYESVYEIENSLLEEIKPYAL